MIVCPFAHLIIEAITQIKVNFSQRMVFTTIVHDKLCNPRDRVAIAERERKRLPRWLISGSFCNRSGYHESGKHPPLRVTECCTPLSRVKAVGPIRKFAPFLVSVVFTVIELHRHASHVRKSQPPCNNSPKRFSRTMFNAAIQSIYDSTHFSMMFRWLPVASDTFTRSQHSSNVKLPRLRK